MQPGDIVFADFQGAQGSKRRPCVVISTEYYHGERPDVLLAAITSQLRQAVSPLDYALQDWEEAGLTQPSLVKIYFGTRMQSQVTPLGRLSERDWEQVQVRLQLSVQFKTTDD